MTNTPDLTARVAALIYHMGECRAIDMQDRQTVIDMRDEIRDLSAALEAERASHTATLKDAQDECARAEAAEAERDAAQDILGKAKDWMQRADDDRLAQKTRTEAAEAERDELKAELAEAVGVMTPFSAFTIDGRDPAADKYPLIAKAVKDLRAFLSRHKKETDT